MTSTIPAPHLVRLTEAAPLLRRHPVTLRKDIAAGTVPGIKIGARWYLSSAVLDRLLAGESVADLEQR